MQGLYRCNHMTTKMCASILRLLMGWNIQGSRTQPVYINDLRAIHTGSWILHWKVQWLLRAPSIIMMRSRWQWIYFRFSCVIWGSTLLIFPSGRNFQGNWEGWSGLAQALLHPTTLERWLDSVLWVDDDLRAVKLKELWVGILPRRPPRWICYHQVVIGNFPIHNRRGFHDWVWNDVNVKGLTIREFMLNRVALVRFRRPGMNIA